jgi:hypothetical protein
MSDLLTLEMCSELFDRLAGTLQDEGWPEPYRKGGLYPYQPYWSICWRRGENGSALILEADANSARLIDRFSARMYVLIQERFVMIDISSQLKLWPGRHDFTTLLGVLRHFKSVID